MLIVILHSASVTVVRILSLKGGMIIYFALVDFVCGFLLQIMKNVSERVVQIAYAL